MCTTLFSYVRERDVLCCRVGGRLDDPCSDPTIMAYLVPNSSGFEGRRAADGWMPLGGLGGAADVGLYGAQWQVRRRPVPVRSAALGLSPQRPAWVRTREGSSHAVNSGGDGIPPA
jgi:hypothetical protein